MTDDGSEFEIEDLFRNSQIMRRSSRKKVEKEDNSVLYAARAIRVSLFPL